MNPYFDTPDVDRPPAESHCPTIEETGIPSPALRAAAVAVSPRKRARQKGHRADPHMGARLRGVDDKDD